MDNIGISLDVSELKNYKYKFKNIQIMLNDDIDFKDIKNFVINNNIKNIFIHSSYKINIADDVVMTNNGLYSLAFDLMNEEIRMMRKLNINNIILHTGINKKKIYNEDHIYDNITKYILYCLKNYPDINIILETSAGEKGELLSNLKDFVDFVLFFKNNPNYNHFFVCIDTCHIFQAGYDLNKPEVIKKVYNIFKPIKDKIKVIHLNDSYYKFNEHKDRHDKIGSGYIKPSNLKKFYKLYPKAICILETGGPFQKQIDKIL
jgi:deoxyribonuclease-4